MSQKRKLNQDNKSDNDGFYDYGSDSVPEGWLDDRDEISRKYTKYDQREHVLERPDTYIGSIQCDQVLTYTFDQETGSFKKENIDYIHGLFKIVDEILANSIDHIIRCKDGPFPVKNIKVEIVDGVFQIMNDGPGIEVVLHPQENIYVPELIFGNMLSSSNFSNEKERIVGGMNGIGAKACNIFSEFFEITTVDHQRKLKYFQRFEQNMSIKSTPKITKCSSKPYTSIKFKPDYFKFNCKGLTNDMYNLIVKRVYDTCVITSKNVNVFFNKVKLEYNTFEKYTNLYTDSAEKVYEKNGERWEYSVVYTKEGTSDCISFVNGINTIKGGRHVDYIMNQIIKKLSDKIIKCNKSVTHVKPSMIKDNLFLVLNCSIVNPNFDSQSKETLTTPIAKFGSKVEVSDKFIEKLYKTGITDHVIRESSRVEIANMSRTDGKKRINLKGIANLDDAFLAGSRKSKDCTLILTEGLSAASFATSGLSVVGREYYGIFPLRGKILNTKDVSIKKISENQEISDLKKIIGLETGKVYQDLNGLRYGKIMIMADQDLDGSHIKGLIFNLFHTLWPSLLEKSGFMVSMLTPIVKVKHNRKELSFFSMQDFDDWKSSTTNWKTFNIKYFKGLGTSTSNEAKEYFKNMKRVNYIWDSNSDNALNLAFDKKQADKRKQWLSLYKKQDTLDYSIDTITFPDFVNKDLIHFSKYDVARSIPSLIDGFKISQRKILYSCFKKNLVSEIKVAQLAGYVSEVTDYKHGENSLQMAIVGMAQDFVGSNNINLLSPNGQFGTRIHLGKDAAQPRYIFTTLSDITSRIFIPQDKNILVYLDEEGTSIEPEYYLPIIPMILVNGAIGIGTGFSTNIPCFNPKDIIHTLTLLLDGKDTDDIHDIKPWYKNFTGTIEFVNNKYISTGVYKKVSTNVLNIIELPIGTSTHDFKLLLDDLVEKGVIKEYKNNSTDLIVQFSITFPSSQALDDFLLDPEKLVNIFKLTSFKHLGVTNMYAFDENGCIKKYKSALDIIKYFYNFRLPYYKKRIDLLIATLSDRVENLENKIRFLQCIITGKIVVGTLSKKSLEQLLKKMGFLENEAAAGSFDYLLNIPIYNLTVDKISNLEHERDTLVKSINEYRNTDVKTVWKKELDELLLVLK